MIKCLGGLLRCIDSSPILTNTQLKEVLSNEVIEHLKNQKLLLPTERREWFCDECLDYHLFDINNPPSVLKCCINQFPPLYEEVSKEEQYDWEWQWAQFKKILRQKNNLAACGEGQKVQDQIVIVGKNSTDWVAWSPANSVHSLLTTALELKLAIQNLRIVLIINSDLTLHQEALNQLEANSIRTYKLQNLLDDEFVLKQVERSPNSIRVDSSGKETLILDHLNKCLIAMGKEIKLPNAVYRMCCVFFNSKGHVLSGEEYEVKLNNMCNDKASGFNISTSVSTLKKLIERECNIELTNQTKPIRNKSGLGYQINKDYWSFKVIND